MKLAISLIFVLSLSMTACRSTSDNLGSTPNVTTTGSSPTPPPTVSPSPTLSPSPSPTPVAGAKWNSVHEQTTCEAMNSAFCQGAYGFKVDNSGRYTVGPDPIGAILIGHVTSNELAQLNNDANAVANNNPRDNPQCVNAGTVPGSSDDVTEVLYDNSMIDVFHETGVPRTTCYRGGPPNAIKLHDDFHALLIKYYPRPYPLE